MDATVARRRALSHSSDQTDSRSVLVIGRIAANLHASAAERVNELGPIGPKECSPGRKAGEQIRRQISAGGA